MGEILSKRGSTDGGYASDVIKAVKINVRGRCLASRYLAWFKLSLQLIGEQIASTRLANDYPIIF